MQLRLVVLLLFLLLTGCAAPPLQTGSLDFRARAETQVDGKVRVSAVALSQQESENSFALPLAKEDIQPVWLEIENQEDKELYLNLLSIDPNYFSPSEVAWMFRGEEDHTLDELNVMLLDKHIRVIIPPHGMVSGFVYTNLDPGVKAFAVELSGEREHRTFEFMQIVPGFEADFMRVDFKSLYAPGEVRDVDLDGLRQYLDDLPCCVLGSDEKTPGDPLNLVIVGKGTHVLATLVRRGWDLTETMRNDTVWRTIASSVFRSKYRTSPVSPLYLFGRSQDAALQKTRGTVDERNHLRLWLAPVTLNGQMVWVGQISRDIGVRFSRKTFVTHKIDPYVDEARLYITLDIAASQSLRALGYVKGVGYSTRESPRFNYTNDPYYTDGQRVVLLLGKGRYPLDRIKFLHWIKLEGRDRETKDLTP
ncbi:MAG: LssY C-terminal domain-containing protein [Thiohalomonadales bacterium]|nr:LssY C-terminal domain-containing protein [Thiohalomonadales bacterium]